MNVVRDPLLQGALLCLVVALLLVPITESVFVMLIPVALAILALTISNLRFVFFSCLVGIVVSTEVQFGSIGLDMPSEPLMLLLTGFGLVYVLKNAGKIEGVLLRHPISLLLLVHLFWIVITTLTSVDKVVSVKFLLAKIWYIVPFYVMTFILIRKKVDLNTLTKTIAIPLALVLLYCVIRHSTYEFSFEFVNKAMSPFFRNHVTYAALTAILLPFFVGAFIRTNSWKKWAYAALVFLSLFVVYTSFTRAAFVSIMIGAALVVVIQYKLTRIALVVSLASLVTVGVFLVSENRFFGFAPDYNKTITHTDFNDLLEATYNLEDISTMERVYRWVAGSYMAGEKPLFGWGPGSFYGNYRGYALESFRTYVSDNPEKSGIHNYLLMLLVEQGWIGLLIFIVLCCVAFLVAERAYHNAPTKAEKAAVLIVVSSLAINLSFQLINDMIETDKCGPWFFMCLALLVVLDQQKNLNSSWTEEEQL